MKPHIVSALVNENIIYPSRKAYQAATPAVRAAFVRNVLAWMKAYTESPAFQADYKQQRAAAKPSPPESKGTPDERLAKYWDEQRSNLEKMKESVAAMPPETQKQMQGTVKQMEATIKQSSEDPQMSAMLKQGYTQEAETERKSYQEDLASYEKKFPADPKVLIAGRLREFLELSKDVAFDARLVSAGGKMKFADPQYEAKSYQWKLCYRAGKEPVEAGRAFAADWLSQLERR